MDEQTLKTKVWQRVVIIAIAILLLGATIMTYLFVVIGSNNGVANNDQSATDQKIAELTEAYDTKQAELLAAAKPLSEQYFPTLKQYRSEVKAYNEAAATADVLKTTDLLEGTGKTLAEGNTNYLAYYIGWCADGSIFQSSFINDQGKEDNESPVALGAPLDPSGGTIEGWMQGVIGMKLGGVRQITMSGDLAYGSTRSICGGYNKPLKFIVMAIPREGNENIVKLSTELQDIWLQMYRAYYGAA